VLPEKRCTHCGETKVLDEFTKHPTTRDGRGSWCKVCTREAARKIREQRPEHCRALVVDWHERHPEYAPAYRKARYAANREQLVADERRRRAARKAAGIKQTLSPEARQRKRLANSKWAMLNAEHQRAYNRARYAAQPGKIRGYQHARKARMRGNGGTFTNAEWVALCAQHGHKCLACGESQPLTVDHVIPLSRGGQNVIGNIQPLCKPCNSRKHLNVIDYRTAEAAAWR
jgi:5-methylcytosine-specific restriction endonuclease McrA